MLFSSGVKMANINTLFTANLSLLPFILMLLLTAVYIYNSQVLIPLNFLKLIKSKLLVCNSAGCLSLYGWETR